MSRRDGPHIPYLNLGPWPGFVGIALDERAFRREMARLMPGEEVRFLTSDRAHATLHSFVSPKGDCCYVLALGSVEGRTKEQVAGLVAHEAMHIVQHMQDDLAQGRTLGVEAEAYLIQMIVQETLQMVWNSTHVRRETPATAKSKRKGARK